jgi:hypothetical protein
MRQKNRTEDDDEHSQARGDKQMSDSLEERLAKLERDMAELKRVLEDNDLWNFEEEEEVTKHG